MFQPFMQADTSLDRSKGGLAKAREFSPEVVLCDIGLPRIG